MGAKTLKVNPDLEKERQKCSFNGEELTNWWYGSAAEVQKRRAIGECIDRGRSVK